MGAPLIEASNNCGNNTLAPWMVSSSRGAQSCFPSYLISLPGFPGKRVILSPFLWCLGAVIASVALELTSYSSGLGGAHKPLFLPALGLEHPISWETKKAWLTVKGALHSRARGS